MTFNLKLLSLCSIVVAMLHTANTSAQTSQTSWVGRMGGASSEMPTYNSVATDGSGNVYLAGPYSAGVSNGPATFSSHNTATFTPAGFSNTTLDFVHSNNQFVYKSNPAGNIQWVKAITGTASGVFNTVVINAIDADAAGNVYITGRYREGVDLDPGTAVVTPTVANSTENNMFLLKLNTAGEYVWHREFRDVAATGTGNAVGFALKVSGTNVYATIQFTASKSLYLPGASTPIANSSLTATGTGNNTAVLKLDNSGNFVWIKHFSTSGSNGSTPYDIDIDATGNIYTVGSFSGTSANQIDFDPSHTTPSGSSAYFSAGSNDIFVSKLSSTGNYLWSKVIGGTSLDECYSLALSSTSVYLAGTISSASIDFNPGGTAATLTNMGNSDAFVAAYALDGTFQWANKYGGAALDQANGITSLPNGDLYIAGRVSRSGVPLDFDPQTPGNQGLTPFATASTANNTEAYLLKLSGTGSFTWVYTSGVPGAGNTNDYCFAVAAYESAGSRSIYTSGSTGSLGASTVEANQAQFPVNLSNLSTTPVIRIAGTGTGGSTGTGADIFLHRALETNCNPTTSAITATACGNYTIGTSNFTQSGIYTLTLTNSANCDSIVTLTLTINPTDTSNFTQTACDSFYFSNQTYYQSGNYTQTFTNSHGCDSIVTMFLAIGESSSSILTETACSNYTLGTQTYTQTGIYTQTIPNALGCDSIITLNLTIAQPDVSVTQSENVLTAQASGMVYQWINCSDNSTIPGATQQSYTATVNGNYAVVVTNDNCSDTSLCLVVNTLSIDAMGKGKNTISIYPNPAALFINLESALSGSFAIISIDGRILKTSKIKKGLSSINISDLTPGLYFIEFHDENKGLKEVIKFVKK